MIGIDSTFIIDFLKGDYGAISKSSDFRGENIITTELNAYEVLVGLYMTNSSQKNFDAFYGLLDKLTVLTLDRDSTKTSAKLFGEKMRKGQRVEQNDCIIAGILKTHGCSKIVTRNISDFKKLGMETLKY